MTIAKNKALLDDTQALLGRNLDLRTDLKKREEDLEESEDSYRRAKVAHKEAKELAEKTAKRLEDLRATLLACMQEAKVAINSAFVKGGAESSGVLPEANPTTFSAWLQAELGQFSQLLDSVANFGAYGAALAFARSF